MNMHRQPRIPERCSDPTGSAPVPLWRGVEDIAAGLQCVPTGFSPLDRALPGGGWPLGNLVEVAAAPQPHVGVELFLPALATRLATRPRAAWVAPPAGLHAPGLAAWEVDPTRILVVEADSDTDRLWAMEQFLGCADCALVLGWVRVMPSHTALRRLQWAAARHTGLGVLFRVGNLTRPSPAALRLRVRAEDHGLEVELVKLRGALGPRRVRLP